MSTNRLLARQGARCKIYFLVVGSCCRIDEFLAGLQPRDLIKTDAELRRFVEHGPSRSEQKFRHLHASVTLWELKPTEQVRLIGFWDSPDEFVVTHGFFKRRTSGTRHEIEVAIRLRDEYYANRD